MFVDDTKIFSEIKTLGDASSLQKDLGKLATWSQSSGLLFNEAKYKAQHITRKTADLIVMFCILVILVSHTLTADYS